MFLRDAISVPCGKTDRRNEINYFRITDKPMQLCLAQETSISQTCWRHCSLVFDVIFSSRSLWFYFPPTQLPVNNNNKIFTHFPRIEIQVNVIPQIRNISVNLTKVLLSIRKHFFPITLETWNLKFYVTEILFIHSASVTWNMKESNDVSHLREGLVHFRSHIAVSVGS